MEHHNINETVNINNNKTAFVLKKKTKINSTKRAKY